MPDGRGLRMVEGRGFYMTAGLELRMGERRGFYMSEGRELRMGEGRGFNAWGPLSFFDLWPLFSFHASLYNLPLPKALVFLGVSLTLAWKGKGTWDKEKHSNCSKALLHQLPPWQGPGLGLCPQGLKWSRWLITFLAVAFTADLSEWAWLETDTTFPSWKD